MDKLSIQNEMSCFDRKDRDFYNSLTDEERKKFSNYLMIRWGSSVQGSRDLQEFYVISTNERLNKHFFAINRHPKLQWLCATIFLMICLHLCQNHRMRASTLIIGKPLQRRLVLTAFVASLKLDTMKTT